MDSNYRLASPAGPRPAAAPPRDRLLLHASHHSGLVARSVHGLDRAAARARAQRLDRELAAGRPPEDTWLLAVRARDLVSAGTRNALAGDWDHLLRVARRLPRPGLRQVAIRRDAVLAVEADIIELVRRLRAPVPVTARGVATARTLLADGAGPLFRYGPRCDLGRELRRAVSQLDPGSSLFQPEPRHG